MKVSTGSLQRSGRRKSNNGNWTEVHVVKCFLWHVGISLYINTFFTMLMIMASSNFLSMLVKRWGPPQSLLKTWGPTQSLFRGNNQEMGQIFSKFLESYFLFFEGTGEELLQFSQAIFFYKRKLQVLMLLEINGIWISPSSIPMPRLTSSGCLEWTSAQESLMRLSFFCSSFLASATSLSKPW